MMKKRITKVMLVWAMGFVASPAFACIAPSFELKDYQVTGKAYADNELVYIETLNYASGERGGTLQVEYAAPDSSLIARKQVDFNCRLSAPDFTITDNIANAVEGASHQQNAIVTFVNQEKQTVNTPASDYVIDAGFDHFVRQNWQPLVSGKTLSADYLFAREGKFLRLRFEKSEAPDNLAKHELEEVVFFKVSANNLLFRLLSSAIYVGYDVNSQELRYYMGPSNVPAMRDYKNIVIEYEYVATDRVGAG